MKKKELRFDTYSALQSDVFVDDDESIKMY